MNRIVLEEWGQGEKRRGEKGTSQITDEQDRPRRQENELRPLFLPYAVAAEADLLTSVGSGALDGGAMWLNHATFHHNPWGLNDYVNDSIAQNGGLYSAANDAMLVSVAASYGAVGLAGAPLVDSASTAAYAYTAAYAPALLQPSTWFAGGFIGSMIATGGDVLQSLFIAMDLAGLAPGTPWPNRRNPRNAGTSCPTGTTKGDPVLAQKIANGHAYDKHILKENEFPGVNTRGEFAEVIGDAIQRAQESRSVRNLDRGRTAYFDGSTGLVVIRDPASVDGGTAFRPLNGRNYFEKLE